MKELNKFIAFIHVMHYSYECRKAAVPERKAALLKLYEQTPTLPRKLKKRARKNLRILWKDVLIDEKMLESEWYSF